MLLRGGKRDDFKRLLHGSERDKRIPKRGVLEIGLFVQALYFLCRKDFLCKAVSSSRNINDPTL
jgi:hypothetical protein